ncbi:hypothetical protein PENTCL1PPCAC_10923, partial [Pristionchus entomophagus]
MTPMLSITPDRNHIQRVLRTLDFERKNSVQYENSNADPGRILMFDFIESFHPQIDRINSKSIVEQCTQTDEISLDLLKEENIVNIEEGEMINENLKRPSLIEDANEVTEVPHPFTDSLDGMSTVSFICQPPQKEPKEELVEPKEEPIDNTQLIPGDDQGDDMGFMEEGMLNDDVVIGNERDDDISDDLIEKVGEKKIVDDSADTSKGSSETVVKSRISSRNIVIQPKYAESLEDSDADSEPAMKKWNVDSEKKNNRVSNLISGKSKQSASKLRRKSWLNDSELECIECEYRTRNIRSWDSHLRRKHFTKLRLVSL